MKWTKFERGSLPKMTADQVMATAKCTRAEAEWFIENDQRQLEAVWLNNLYQVNVYKVDAIPPDGPPLLWLSIKRRDKAPVHDWRHFQRIKNEIVGPEYEGVELYPAESRLVDTANQYHLYVVADPKFRFPWGFNERSVCVEEVNAAYRQRAIEKGDQP